MFTRIQGVEAGHAEASHPLKSVPHLAVDAGSGKELAIAVERDA